MPGARSGGSSGGGGGGSSSGDASGAVTVWEVVSLLAKLLGTVAALKVVLYLLRVCLAMAWKSGGASHSELIHNLRSKCHPRPVWGSWGRLGLDRVPWTVRNVLGASPGPRPHLHSASVAGLLRSRDGGGELQALATGCPGTCPWQDGRRGDGALGSPPPPLLLGLSVPRRAGEKGARPGSGLGRRGA